MSRWNRREIELNPPKNSDGSIKPVRIQANDSVKGKGFIYLTLSEEDNSGAFCLWLTPDQMVDLSIWLAQTAVIERNSKDDNELDPTPF